ncbi:MAG: hypothetical protein IKS51_01145 [Erysipelotrichaceae bacterium]|nr:hypothetical protein [Erysipelotrichaceae bacterium]
MDRRRKENLLILAALTIVAVSFLFMFSKRWHSRLNGNDSLDVTKIHDATTVSSFLGRGTDVRQDFTCPYDTIKELVIIFNKTDDTNQENVTVSLLEGQETLFSQTVSVSDISDQHRTRIPVGISGCKGHSLTLDITSDSDTGLALMIDEKTEAYYRFDDQTLKGTICFAIYGN